jgi:hypothetical protein
VHQKVGLAGPGQCANECVALSGLGPIDDCILLFGEHLKIPFLNVSLIPFSEKYASVFSADGVLIDLDGGRCLNSSMNKIAKEPQANP